MSVFDWSTTAGSNGDSDSNINFAEGQAPSTVNDSARALMARVAHWLNMLGSNVTQGGASNAYTFTTDESLSAYSAGMRFLWQPNADSTGAVTLNVDTIGAKKVYMPDGTQAGSGELDADSLYDVVYDASLDTSNGGFKIVGFPDTTLTAGDYLTVANDLSDVSSASAARGNLGLGTMALAATADYAALAGAAFTGAVTMAADFNVDSGTLFVDVSTDRVGIGTTSPGATLDVDGEFISKAKVNSGVSGTLTQASHGKGQVSGISGAITMPALGLGSRGTLINDGSVDRVITGSSVTMYVNGSSVASCTLPSRGVCSFRFVGNSLLYVSGDVY